ncbi:hypothetical protein NUSPORA_01392 [Nucleospora cyclopteri]
MRKVIKKKSAVKRKNLSSKLSLFNISTQKEIIERNESLMKTVTDISKEINSKKSRQFLIISPDELVLEETVEKIKKQVIKEDKRSKNERRSPFIEFKWVGNVEKTEDASKCDNKVFIIELLTKTTMQYQSLLYYYLELPLKYNCFIILLSNSSQCLNSLEKRVKSRFKHKIYSIKYCNIEIIENKSEENVKNKGVASEIGINSKTTDFLEQLNHYNHYKLFKSGLEDFEIYKFHIKYQLDFYSVEFICNLLENLHFVLLIVSFNTNIKSNTVIEDFKKFIVKYNVNEFKKIRNIDIMHSYYDLVEFKLIASNGESLIEKNEIRNYVINNCPLYLKKLIQKAIN